MGGGFVDRNQMTHCGEPPHTARPHGLLSVQQDAAQEASVSAQEWGLKLRM